MQDGARLDSQILTAYNRVSTKPAKKTARKGSLFLLLLLFQMAFCCCQSLRDKFGHFDPAGDKILADGDALVDCYVEAQYSPKRRGKGRAGYILHQRIQAHTEDQRRNQSGLAPEAFIADGAVDAPFYLRFGKAGGQVNDDKRTAEQKYGAIAFR